MMPWACAAAPSWAFDDNDQPPNNERKKWDDCHSALNIPKAPEGIYGLSLTLRYNFLVRLHVGWAP